MGTVVKSFTNVFVELRPVLVAVYDLEQAARPPLFKVEWSEVRELAGCDHFLIVFGFVAAAF